MNRLTLLIVILLTGACQQKDMKQEITQIQNAIDKGDFIQSQERIEAWLADKQITDEERSTLFFEIERMNRIRKDFQKTRSDIFSTIHHFNENLTDEQFEEYDKQGLLEFKMIDGEKKYFNRAGTNLYHINKEAKKSITRNGSFYKDNAVLYYPHSHHEEVIKAHLETKSQYVKPRKFTITYTLTVDKDAVPAGEVVRVWIPYPREVEDRQEEITLLYTSEPEYILAPNSTPQRTIYMEKAAQSGKNSEFQVTYSYRSHAFYQDINSDMVRKIELDDNLTYYTAERYPHIRFTDDLRAVSDSLVGRETNPYEAAKKLFEYVDKIPWASAREYSTIRNISDYAFRAGHADCGQVTLLLITLLRMNGIPAKWQSGWEFAPNGFDTMHDWGMFYLEPYGWLPMDVTHGLLNSDDDRVKWFYLGGIDSYRLIFNDDYSRPFYPEKKHFRSETVDSQRGEVEWAGGNLYFDTWTYDMEWEVENL